MDYQSKAFKDQIPNLVPVYLDTVRRYRRIALLALEVPREVTYSIRANDVFELDCLINEISGASTGSYSQVARKQDGAYEIESADELKYAFGVCVDLDGLVEFYNSLSIEDGSDLNALNKELRALKDEFRRLGNRVEKRSKDARPQQVAREVHGNQTRLSR